MVSELQLNKAATKSRVPGLLGHTRGRGGGLTQNTSFWYYVNDALWSCEMWVFTRLPGSRHSW